MYHFGAMMLVRIALIIHDNGAIVCVYFVLLCVGKQVGRHGTVWYVKRPDQEVDEEVGRVLIGWEEKVLLTFIMAKMY